MFLGFVSRYVCVRRVLTRCHLQFLAHVNYPGTDLVTEYLELEVEDSSAFQSVERSASSSQGPQEMEHQSTMEQKQEEALPPRPPPSHPRSGDGQNKLASGAELAASFPALCVNVCSIISGSSQPRKLVSAAELGCEGRSVGR